MCGWGGDGDRVGWWVGLVGENKKSGPTKTRREANALCRKTNRRKWKMSFLP